MTTDTNPQIQIEIPMQLLEAASIIAAKQDIRQYLNGVAIDQGHVVSTDGHRAFACPVAELPDDLQIIIPTDAIKFLLKKVSTKNRKKSCVLNFNLKTLKGELAYPPLNVQESFTAIDGKYPDWKRIFPKDRTDEDYNGTLPQFNWQYMADFQKVEKALGGNGKNVHLLPTSVNGVATVKFPDQPFSQAKGCLAPLRA